MKANWDMVKLPSTAVMSMRPGGPLNERVNCSENSGAMSIKVEDSRIVKIRFIKRA